MLVYEFLYALFFILYLPKILYNAWKQGSWRVVQRRLFPKPIAKPPESTSPVIWVHAVSVGETVAVVPIIRKLLERYPKAIVVTSHVTQAGVDTATSLLPEGKHLLLPFECRFLYRILLWNIQKIDLLLYSEGDVWPLFTHLARQRGAFVSLVNGKMSDRSFSRYGTFRFLFRFAFRGVDRFCLQSALFEKRFTELGIAHSRCVVTGNTKADMVPLVASEKRACLDQIGSKPIIVLASTHEPEEHEMIGVALKYRWFDVCRLVIIPRHSHRFLSVYRDVRRLFVQLQTRLLSQWEKKTEEQWDILVVDTMGLVSYFYQLAYLAVICGSFVDHIGGHNILEPAAFFCPFFVGPHMHAQQHLVESASSFGALLQCATYEELGRDVHAMLINRGMRDEVSHNAFSWAQSMRGAADRTVEALCV